MLIYFAQELSTLMNVDPVLISFLHVCMAGANRDMTRCDDDQRRCLFLIKNWLIHKIVILKYGNIKENKVKIKRNMHSFEILHYVTLLFTPFYWVNLLSK